MNHQLINRFVEFLKRVTGNAESYGGYCRVIKNEVGTEEFRLYRLGLHQIEQIIAVPDRTSWLNFYFYEHAGQVGFALLADSKFQFEGQQQGILISVAPGFLPEKMQCHIVSLQKTTRSPQLSTAVSVKQRQELHIVMNKIEELMDCDYAFRKEYIQELTIQLVHFLLKRAGRLQEQFPFFLN